MYKRIPATCFDTYEDVYNAVENFISEAWSTPVSYPGLFNNTIKYTVFHDPFSNHYLAIALHNDNKISFYVFNGGKVGSIDEMNDIPTYDERDGTATGVAIELCPQYTGRADLICIYTAKCIIICYAPVDCNLYSHIYSYSYLNRCQLFFYGQFTKYHRQFFDYDTYRFDGINDVICVFSNLCSRSIYGNITANYIDKFFDYENYDEKLPSEYKMRNEYRRGVGLVYCHPEATHDLKENTWFIWQNIYEWYYKLNFKYKYEEELEEEGETVLHDMSKILPALVTSFDTFPDNISHSGINAEVPHVPNYYPMLPQKERSSIRSGSILNNSSVLLPLIFYGVREPKKLNTWSAIGETKLINLVDMRYVTSGDIFIDTGIDKDLHRYIVLPMFNLNNPPLDEYDTEDVDNTYEYSLGVAIEIEAKEDLLHSQSEDYLTINLNDRFRNFDRIEVVYGDNKEIEWRYDDLNVIYDTEGIFNLTKDVDERCLVYGLKNTDGESTEYRFTCSESCKIISITGYRE